MSTILSTKRRRSTQLLWSKLDQYVGPIINKGLVLAISGGPDSRALLESMARWRPRLGARILVVCLDHGVREQSRAEARITLMRARRLGFKIKHIELFSDNNLGEQELRERRYKNLIKACESINTKYICTAHHRDDNAEGYLMSLFGIGGGALGAAMDAYEPMGAYTIVRPFVGITKKSLLLSLSLSNYTDFVVDNLDQDRAGQRAWVRHEVLPQMAAHEARIAERLAYFAQQERLKKAALTRLAHNLIIWSDQEALIKLDSDPEPVLIDMAIRHVLKKWSKNLDLRQAGVTVAKLAGLDHSSKKIIVKNSEARKFALPGAMAFSNGREIVIKRV
jgi:tRNA(Ile)-lysidine synthase